jgi:hypothetical protein
MNRNDTINMLCKLVTQVGQEVYGSTLEHDCFCTEKDILGHDHRVHPEVVAFIINATMEKMFALRDLKARHAQELRAFNPPSI